MGGAIALLLLITDSTTNLLIDESHLEYLTVNNTGLMTSILKNGRSGALKPDRLGLMWKVNKYSHARDWVPRRANKTTP